MHTSNLESQKEEKKSPEKRGLSLFLYFVKETTEVLCDVDIINRISSVVTRCFVVLAERYNTVVHDGGKRPHPSLSIITLPREHCSNIHNRER